MSLNKSDLGPIGSLAVALGLFTPGGSPNPDWFGDPGKALSSMLADPDQRAALIAFVDEALGGADRSTEAGVTWLPLVEISNPALSLAVTIDEAADDGSLHIGLGLRAATHSPDSQTMLSIPLFRAKKKNGPAVSTPLLLGTVGGRIRIGTQLTLNSAPPVPGQARLGGIGIDVDLPTNPSDAKKPVFGLTLSGMQLPGANTPRDLRVAADGADELDDALLDLVLSLLRAQADALPATHPVAALAGLLGLRNGDAVLDFPITELPTRGVLALADWLRGIVTTPAARSDWIGHLARLLGGAPVGDIARFTLPGGAAQIDVGLQVDTAANGHTRLAPTLAVGLGNNAARVQVLATLLRVDLVDGSATALPSFGLFAAAGAPGVGQRVLDANVPATGTTPAMAVRADTLRIGFALDAQRRLNFVLAADGVKLGAHDYLTLDLTSASAVMDAIGNTVGDVADSLLGSLGSALPVARLLFGLDAPAGITPVTISALMADPLAAVSGYWQQLVGNAAAAATVLAPLRLALTDDSRRLDVVQGLGTTASPWRLTLIGPLALELSFDAGQLSVGAAAVTSVDALGQRCTVVETRIAATLARIDFAQRRAVLLPGVEALLTARERGTNPPRVVLNLASGVQLRAEHVGLRLAWAAGGALSADVEAPGLALDAPGARVLVALPSIAADGSVTLPPEAWNGIELLVGQLGELLADTAPAQGAAFLRDLTRALGWSAPADAAGTLEGVGSRLRLADLVAGASQAQAALASWLPQLLLSELGPRALAVVADLLAGAGTLRGFVQGTGHPEDPYRCTVAPGLPEPFVAFPPQGLEPKLVLAPLALQRWRAVDPGLPFEALELALRAEAKVDADLRDLVEGREIATGLAALATRWAGGDGRIVAPATPPAGITLRSAGLAVGQMLAQLNLRDLIGRTPTTTVYVALGANAWPSLPAGAHALDLSTPGLSAAMFAPPVAAGGDWFVSLGTRADCRAAGSATDGTPEQAARLAVLLGVLAGISNDIALVVLAGAGHAARFAADASAAVTDLVLLGTPLGPIALTAVNTQPTADALRLLARLLPVPAAGAPRDDEALALGRALVGAMAELVPLADAGADLRPAVAPAPATRAGLKVTALFGNVAASRVQQAITAVVAAGLAARARARAAAPALPPPTGIRAGLRWTLPFSSAGTMAIQASAELTLLAFDRSTGLAPPAGARALRVTLRIADRIGWLVSNADAELRAISADISVPLDGSAAGSTRIVLHDARVFAQSWERLVLGTDRGSALVAAVLPEARVLLAAAVQRLVADVAAPPSVALVQLMRALGIIAASGDAGVVADAVDHLVHDAGGLLHARMAVAQAEIGAAVSTLLGAAGLGIDLAARSVRVQGGSASAGRFGFEADLTASYAAPAAGASPLVGHVSFGSDTAASPAGAVQLRLDLQAAAPHLAATLKWTHADGQADTVPLWPAPDAAAIARALVHAAPALAGQSALELMRRADASVKPIINALLDALGLLGGVAADAERAIRPIAGLLRDPAAWLRSAGSLASSPTRVQSALDALRPLVGLGGTPGSPLPIANGVSLAVAADGAGARLSLAVDPSGWTPPSGVTARLSGGIAASLSMQPSGPPGAGVEVFIGLPQASPASAGRQAVHARISAGSGLEVFLRPASGADIGLLPFAGLGALAAAAQAALPFLLDQLAQLPAPTGPLVGNVGDALALRSGGPPKFDGAALQNWAANPVAALTNALPSITSTGLTAIAPLLDAYLPAAVNASESGGSLNVTVGPVALGWNPTAGTATVAVNNLAVPGIEHLSARLVISAAGLNEISATVGPASINAGGVLLRPFATFAAGTAPAGGRRVAVGMAAGGNNRFALRFLLDTHAVDLVAQVAGVDPLALPGESTDPLQVALRIVDVIADLAASVAMAQPAVTQLLNQNVGVISIRNLLRGVLLADVANPNALIASPFDGGTLLPRVQRLFTNLAGAGLSIGFGDLAVSFTTIDSRIGFQLGVAEHKRVQLFSRDITLWLENDDRWIIPDPPGAGGLFVGLLPAAGPLSFKPNLVVNGLGLRVGRQSGPLFELGIALESIALHVFAALDTSGARAGGVQLQFSNLAVAASSAGGENGVAKGITKDTGPTPPKPAFSPALAVQKHGSNPVQVTLRAGDGDGPWWIAIQRGFGPLYLEQVGLGVKMPGGKIQTVSLLMDGSVSLFGLTCAVDDLQITYFADRGDFFNAGNWAVDLAGLAVSANMAGLTIAGGLLKLESDKGIEYLGMLLGRFAVYGITLYGGYGEGKDKQNNKFTAFFAVGAVNGPIGGPPAFFLTGIGGGFGINRQLVIPTDLSNFATYPLIQALDIAAQPQDPMKQLRALADFFPMNKGTFWFAAGLSFNSFALVDGIAVVGVQVGDGLDINLLGLARMALPRPQVALVSIELALLVRFSSSEGVLWVQGQLTDNSWLLVPSIKLTGGFAYVLWFGGEHRGEFVLTLGGYHPDFHKSYYPSVPRLGLRWSVSDAIVVKAGSYFALCSEALMAGGDFEASAHFGPAWAEVKFGAHGIVFFDPFRYHVNAYASIAAGVTIDTWIFGEVTISISIGARIDVTGPEFHGRVTFDVGPISLTVEFGGDEKTSIQPISAEAFINKYLEMAESGEGAAAHALLTDRGSVPAKGEKSTPDGSAGRPFVAVAEFSMSFTSAVPIVKIERATVGPPVVTTHDPSKLMGVAPMLETSFVPRVKFTWLRGGAVLPFPFGVSTRPFGRFPAGAWGPPQDLNNPKLPKGEVIQALSDLGLDCSALVSPPGPEVPYFQVEIGVRKPLPLTRSSIDINKLRSGAQGVSNLLTGNVATPPDAQAAFGNAQRFLRRSASPTTLAALAGERQAPPLMGTLTEGLEARTRTEVPVVRTVPPPAAFDHFIDAPVAVALLSGTLAATRAAAGAVAASRSIAVREASKASARATAPRRAAPLVTTVKDGAKAWRVAPPTLAQVEAERSRSIAARLVLVDAPAVRLATTRSTATLIASAEVPPSAGAQASQALVARTGAALPQPLQDLSTALTARTGAGLAAGQALVLKMPNASGDAATAARRPKISVAGAPARLVLLGHGGTCLVDAAFGPAASGAAAAAVTLPQGTERIAAVGLGAAVGVVDPRTALWGWHAGLQMPYLGWGSALAPGCLVNASGEALRQHRQRQDGGWVSGAELAKGTSTVATRFAEPPRTVLIVLDDPAAVEDSAGGRQLLLGLSGATRAQDAAGTDIPPRLLSMDNRSVLAYDIVPDAAADGAAIEPVIVSIASQPGWSLVGVMGSAALDSRAALALIASAGLDAALAPLALVSAQAANTAATTSRLNWIGPTRTPQQRQLAQARAGGNLALAKQLARRAKEEA